MLVSLAYGGGACDVRLFTCLDRASYTCLSTFPLEFDSHQLTFQTNPSTQGQPSTQQTGVNYNATHGISHHLGGGN